MCGPGVDGKDGDKTMVVHQDAPQDAENTVPQGDPQDADLSDGAIVDPSRGAIDHPITSTGAPAVSLLVSSDTLLDSTDPRHQPGSVTAHQHASGSMQGPVADPQDDGQNRGAQVDPQPMPATNSNAGASMQDIDEDDDEVHDQTQVPEIPANWEPAPPSLSCISQELGSPVFDADGLLVEGNHSGQSPRQTFK